MRTARRDSSTRTGRRKTPYRDRLDAIVASFLTEVIDVARRGLPPAESMEGADSLDGRRLGIRSLRALKRAIGWQLQLETGRARSIADIARRAGTPRSAVMRSLRLLDGLASARGKPAAASGLAQERANRPVAVAIGGRLATYHELRNRTLREFETEYVTAALRAAAGNLSMAARIARMDRKHLWRLLRRTGVQR
jgi:DNA-binding phage protein